MYEKLTKMPEFYIIIAGKILFPKYRGHVPPISYAYGTEWATVIKDVARSISLGA